MGFVSGQHLIFLLIFLAVVLIVFGPGKLPEVGSGVGKAIREFRKATTDVKDQVVNGTASTPEEPVRPVVTPVTPVTPVVPAGQEAEPVAGRSSNTRTGG